MLHNSKPQLFSPSSHFNRTFFLFLFSLRFRTDVTLWWNGMPQSLTWNSILKTTLLEQQQKYWKLKYFFLCVLLRWRYENDSEWSKMNKLSVLSSVHVVVTQNEWMYNNAGCLKPRTSRMSCCLFFRNWISLNSPFLWINLPSVETQSS